MNTLIDVPSYISTEEEYDKFLPIVERLVFKNMKKELSVEEHILYNHLVHIIEEWEEMNYPMGKSTPTELLNHIIESSQIDMDKLCNIMNVDYELLTQIREGIIHITKEQALALGNHFKVNYTLFTGE